MGGSVGVLPHDKTEEEMKGVFVYLILNCDLPQAKAMLQSVGVNLQLTPFVDVDAEDLWLKPRRGD